MKGYDSLSSDVPKVKIGCCGFPIGRRTYFRLLSCVEIQQTFYHPPDLKTIVRWCQEAPKGFEFIIKAWQLITHTPQSPTYRRLKMDIPANKMRCYGFFRPTEEVLMAWETIKNVAEALECHIILFQSPSSFVSSAQNRAHMEEFFRSIERKKFIIAWEPRGWGEDEIFEVCKKLDLIHVVDPFKASSRWGNITYYRLHGKNGYHYRYSDADLLYLKELIHPIKATYVMFNNTSMLQDCLRFKEIEKREGYVGF
jgi:Uncharacterized conserved protein